MTVRRKLVRRHRKEAIVVRNVFHLFALLAKILITYGTKHLSCPSETVNEN